MTPEQLFLAELALIRRVTGWVCARHGVAAPDAEDFQSTVLERLIESDYAALAKYQGRGPLSSYLVVVIGRFWLDFQDRRLGKWRASAEARRRGSLAIRLERLLYRDGLTFDEACGVLSNDPKMAASRDELYALSVALPLRGPKHSDPSGTASSAEEPSSTTGPDPAERVEREALADRTLATLRRCLARLPAAARIFLRLHVEDGFTVAEVARMRGVDQKALYRQRDALLKRLRFEMQAEGITIADVQELLANVDWSYLATDPAAFPDEPAGPRGGTP
jgi:RNA polymerase sigma factor (sigma-70 family)